MTFGGRYKYNYDTPFTCHRTQELVQEHKTIQHVQIHNQMSIKP